MIYVLHLLDRADGAALRQQVRAEHKAYLGAVADRIAFAGPLTGDDGVTMIGSLLAIDFDSRDAAQAWLAEEPFTRAGLYASVEIHAFENLWPQRVGFPPATPSRANAQIPSAGSGPAAIHPPTGDDHVQTL